MFIIPTMITAIPIATERSARISIGTVMRTVSRLIATSKTIRSMHSTPIIRRTIQAASHAIPRRHTIGDERYAL